MGMALECKRPPKCPLCSPCVSVWKDHLLHLGITGGRSPVFWREREEGFPRGGGAVRSRGCPQRRRGKRREQEKAWAPGTCLRRFDSFVISLSTVKVIFVL